VGGRVMAGARGEPIAQHLCATPDLQVLCEPVGELLGRDDLLFVAPGFRLEYRGERAALEQDEGCGGAGEVRVALESVRSLRVAGLQVEADQLTQGDLEDLQLVL
jgi:hypothetical protein